MAGVTAAWIATWCAAVFIQLLLVSSLWVWGSKSIFSLIAYFTKRRIDAYVWDKSCDTSIVAQRDDRFTEVHSSFKLEVTYEIDDDGRAASYYAYLSVSADQYHASLETEKMQLPHVYSRLLRISRVVPEVRFTTVLFALFCALTPILWLILVEGVISVHTNGSVENSVLFHLGPFLATFVGLILYAFAFALNIFGIRHDTITVEASTSRRVLQMPNGWIGASGGATTTNPPARPRPSADDDEEEEESDPKQRLLPQK